MDPKNITYAYDLLKEKTGLEELKYYISDADEKFLPGFSINLASGKNLTNIPLSARIIIRRTLLRELDNLIYNIDKEIKAL